MLKNVYGWQFWKSPLWDIFFFNLNPERWSPRGQIIDGSALPLLD